MDNDTQFYTVTDSPGDEFIWDMSMVQYVRSKGFWFNKKIQIGLKDGQILVAKMGSSANATNVICDITERLYNIAKWEALMENDDVRQIHTVTDTSGDNFILDMSMVQYACSKGFWFNKKILIGFKNGQRSVLKVRPSAAAKTLMCYIAKGLKNTHNIEKWEVKDV
jgi:hypothetical protein